VCLNIKILTNSNQQTQSYKFTSQIAAFLSVVLITEMLEICIQTSYDQNVQLILKSYLPVVYGTPLIQSEPSLSYMYIIARTSYIQGDDDDVCFVLDQYAEFVNEGVIVAFNGY
jgi:hypothetical protein